MTSEELIVEARKLLGIPFMHQGRSEYGLDCAGMIVYLMGKAGKIPASYIDPKNYGRRPRNEMLTLISQYCTRAHTPIPGTVVLIRWSIDKVPSHIALCAGDTLIHSYASIKKVVENSYIGQWRRDTHSIWKLPGVTYV